LPIGQNRVGEGPEAAFAGDLGAGAPFRPERQVNILELGFGGGRVDFFLQRLGRFALAADRFENGDAARFKLA
jgi:hypothetical protein